ncbi:MAG: hypothetical protein JWP87_6359, partial [Labilithrix sp.]|nr:hypothetical protein [Labilithrix sp.]
FSATSCTQGVVTETLDEESTRDFSGIAMPGDPSKLQPVELHERNTWGTALSADALAYPTATPEERLLYDFEDPNSPLHFFATPHTDEEGVGPLFNQRMCLGCHLNSEDNKNNLAAGAPVSAPGNINTVNTPVSRANRRGNTDHKRITKEYGNPPTAAFTLYGDYSPSNGSFNPISELGGPLQHIQAVGECKINDIPPFSIDPYLQGGIDPVTNTSPLGLRRGMGERAAPPYVARGLMEAIHYTDLLANEDLDDHVRTTSSLLPQPDPAICPGDCISGRHNEGRASDSFVGGDPVVRVGRFGLRGTGTTMLQFDVGGTQGEIGLTSPFSPVEQPNIDTPNLLCDKVADPEISAETVLHLRDMLRNIAPPRHADALYENPPVSQDARDVQDGARLFGLDLDAFRSRMTTGAQPVGLGNPDADHGIAADRQLGCASCHIPIMKTGQSPAKVGGQHLSNRWAPVFWDGLIHKNPELPPGTRAGTIPGNINRDLADYAVPPSVTGIANGNEFRTPPLMGLGRVGPPFFHDARVYLNVVGNGNYLGDPPTPPAATVFTSADTGVNVVEEIRSVDMAVLAAIELHDLPAPPGNDYKNCPTASPANDVCGRASQWRGEARNTMEKFRLLTRAQQMQVVKFLLSL